MTGDARVVEPGHHLIVTLDSIIRLYGPASPPAEEQRAAKADPIRIQAAFETRANRTRLEAQQLATNQVIEERARAILTASGCTEATTGIRGFRFTTNHLAVRLHAVDAEGIDFPLLTDSYA
ncbi:hypothetical protein, partial [Streptomyces sp. NPDC059003]|uniref:hypothetical protein n=1 Tax=Streptomyces sp. NPDC059003 TaxID=3346691 RepID=UPI00368EAE65